MTSNYVEQIVGSNSKSDKEELSLINPVEAFSCCNCSMTDDPTTDDPTTGDPRPITQRPMISFLFMPGSDQWPWRKELILRRTEKEWN